jgi:hypothetical protein
LVSSFPGVGEPIAYLWGDSLETYVSEKGDVNVGRITEDATPHSHRHKLALLKLFPKTVTTPPGEWPGVVCSDKDCIEVVFLKEVLLASIECVRVSQQEYLRLHHLAFDDLAHKAPEESRALAQDFFEILQAESRKIIKLERV